MKFAKTFCKPSSVVVPVPAGLPIKLQYNEHGLLQKVTIGFTIDLDSFYQDPDAGQFDENDLLKKIKKFVPGTISTKGGTTWIFGILYSDDIPCDEGIIPQALYKSYIADIIKGSKYVFYAGLVKSLAFQFNGWLVIRNFLTSNKFNILPHTVVPVSMTDETLQLMVNSGTYPFKYPYISGFFIFEDLSCRYFPLNAMQIVVNKDINMFVDADGYFKGEVITKSGRTYVFNYSSVINHGLAKGVVILADREYENSALTIMAVRMKKSLEMIKAGSSTQVKCPVCGKVMLCGGNDDPIQCDDPHCLSHSYSDAVKMMASLGLPSMSYNSYKALVDSKAITCLTDLIELPPCKDVEIKTTLANAIYSAIPTSVVPNFSVIQRFVNKCNSNMETALYYMNNPKRIETDLDIIDPIVRRFISWLGDPYNISSVETILSRVVLETRLCKFDGDPIFRGVKFAITGKFKRGDYREIDSILRSYSADVVPEIESGEKLPDVVLIGSLNDGVSGKMIQKARMHSIPIQYEDEFFARYEIDKDLASNLL